MRLKKALNEVFKNLIAKNKAKKVFVTLLVIMLAAPFEAVLQLRGVSAFPSSGSAVYEVLANPAYIQEGLNTTIIVNVGEGINDTIYNLRINVTNPAGIFSFIDLDVLTNATGFGSNSTVYWGNFTGANTSLVGLYGIAVQNVTTGQSLASANFTAGLTNKLKYQGNENVNIQGAGYNPSENVTVDIKLAGVSVLGYPKNITAGGDGVATHSWKVPINATPGLYSVSLTNATSPGTVKTPADTQNITILEVEHSVFVNPSRIQEGLNTSITLQVRQAAIDTTYTLRINVTTPHPAGVFYLANLTFTTNGTGFGTNSTKYWGDFLGANTNLVGIYRIVIKDLISNKTLPPANFTVGLTDKLEYRVNETVLIQGAGYGSLEIVTADIKVGGLSVATFPKNSTANTDGVVTFSWNISSQATLGIYTLTLTNATSPGTVKATPDTQTFEVFGFTCQIQTVNLAKQPIADVTVKVYNATTSTYLNITGTTNSSGWVRFTLNSGNYTFKAFLMNVEIGILSNETVSQNVVLTLELQLTHMRIVVEDDAKKRLSFIDLKLQTEYEVKLFRTNATGTWEIYNLFVNMSYAIEAKRYDLLLPGTPIQSKTSRSDWNNITIVAPTYTMLVHVLDSQNNPADDLDLVAYEWSSGITGEPAQRGTTDYDGNVTLSLTFGRYRLRLYKDTTFLNEVTVDLIKNQSLVVNCDVYNVNLSVRVVDYFGQPIPNVLVVFQRRINSNYQTTETQTTGADGIAYFDDIIGGDSRVYVSVEGRPSETQYLYLVGPSRDVVFKMDGYVAFVGYALETTQFLTIILLLILIVAFIIVSNYKRLLRLFQKREK